MQNPDNLPLVSLITVNYNGWDYLQILFDSLRQVTYPNIEIIMVDNASSDNSVALTRKRYPEIKIVQNRQNYMFARGNNEGIQKAAGDIICLINNDVKVEPGFLDPVIAAFLQDPGLAAAQPKVLDLSEPDRFEYAGAAGGYIDRYGYPFMRGRLFFSLEKDHGQYNEEVNIFWASGACFFIRKRVLDQIGLLDDAFVMHMEEIDLCWRMHLQGLQIRYIPGASVWHKGGGTLSAENPRKVYWNYRNNIFLLVKNLSFFNLCRVLSARLFMDAAAMAGELVRGKSRSSWAILQAYGWVFKNFRMIVEHRQRNQSVRKVDDNRIFRLIYQGSIVWEYFIRGRKKFSELKYAARLGQKDQKTQEIKEYAL
ncbi:MAG: glycosyltransferase family 2 protein [Calditrichia bacterium]